MYVGLVTIVMQDLQFQTDIQHLQAITLMMVILHKQNVHRVSLSKDTVPMIQHLLMAKLQHFMALIELLMQLQLRGLCTKQM